jgi:hypothetical protein
MSADKMPSGGTDAATTANATERPGWHYLKDMAEPPELAQAIEETCRKHRYRRPADRQFVADEYKMQYYFGGRDIAYLVTPKGRAVVAVGEMNTEAFTAALARLTPEERGRTILHSPEPWGDDTTYL